MVRTEIPIPWAKLFNACWNPLYHMLTSVLPGVVHTPKTFSKTFYDIHAIRLHIVLVIFQASKLKDNAMEYYSRTTRAVTICDQSHFVISSRRIV